MCGVPYHSAESYIARLTQKGYRVAICEQMEAPSAATKFGSVRRNNAHHHAGHDDETPRYCARHENQFSGRRDAGRYARGLLRLWMSLPVSFEQPRWSWRMPGLRSRL